MAISPPSDQLLPDEAYQHAYLYFVQALQSLAKEPQAACEDYGNFNVARELQQDVSAGTYMFNNPACRLASAEKAAILELSCALLSLPEEAVRFTNIVEESLAHMQHPAWASIRLQARHLLTVLEPITQANAEYFCPQGRQV